jgi:hypothetical protein
VRVPSPRRGSQSTSSSGLGSARPSDERICLFVPFDFRNPFRELAEEVRSSEPPSIVFFVLRSSALSGSTSGFTANRRRADSPRSAPPSTLERQANEIPTTINQSFDVSSTNHGWNASSASYSREEDLARLRRPGMPRSRSVETFPCSRVPVLACSDFWVTGSSSSRSRPRAVAFSLADARTRALYSIYRTRVSKSTSPPSPC